MEGLLYEVDTIHTGVGNPVAINDRVFYCTQLSSVRVNTSVFGTGNVGSNPASTSNF